MNVDAHLLLFNTAFRLSYGTSRYRLLVCLRMSEGTHFGLGSGIYYACPPIKAYRDLQKVLLPLLREARLDNLDEMRNRVANLYGHIDGGALYAADTALWDMEARFKYKTVGAILGFGNVKRIKIPITEQLWAVPPDKLESELKTILGRGTTQIKVKVRMGVDGGVNYLKHIREICGSHIRLKIDPNGQYQNMKLAVNSLLAMEDMAVELVEDPLPAIFDFRKIRELKNSLTSMKVMLDYNMSDVDTIDRALDNDAFDIINIKLSRVGGITRAIPLIRRCIEAGKQISIGCNEDLGPAMYGILQLSSVIPNYFGTEGVGWYRLNTKILKFEPEIVEGNVHLPDCNGLQKSTEFNFMGNYFQEKVVYNPTPHFIYSSMQRRGYNLYSRVMHKVFRK